MDRSTEQPGSDRLIAASAGVLGGDDPLGRSLERWAAEALVDESARARERARWLRIQAEEEASFAGTLVDLAEQARPVVIDVGDQRFRGVIAGIGGDFVAVRTDRGQQVIIRTATIDAVRTEPGGTDVRGDRPATVEVTLGGVIGPIAADRPDVLVRTVRGVSIRGGLRSAGTDVLHLRVEGDPPTPAWVPLDAVAIIVLEG